MTPFTILVTIAIILGVVSLIKPAWPLVGVAVILLAVAMLIGK